MPPLRRWSRLAPWNLLRALDQLEELPALRTQLEQCRVAYRSDARWAQRAEKAVARIAHPKSLDHLRRAVDAAALQSDPCPYIVIERLLPDDVYDEMVAAIPPSIFFEHMKFNRQDLEVPFEFAPRYHREAWRAFQESLVEGVFQPALADKFKNGIDALLRTYWPGVEYDARDLGTISSRLMRRRPGYEIKPHRDPRWAFLTCIFYLTKRQDTRSYGTKLHRLKTERDAPSHSPFWVSESECEMVREVPGLPNSAVIFLNSTGVHSASIPADAPPETDRYIYQLQFGPVGTSRERLIAALHPDDAPMWTQKSTGHSYK